MRTSDLHFDYPEQLVASEPQDNFRILHTGAPQYEPNEINKSQLMQLFRAGDVLVINDTSVLKRRVTAENGVEILFLNEISPNEWAVLCPAREISLNQTFHLPENIKVELLEKGLPQRLRVHGAERHSAQTDTTRSVLNDDYFQRQGELALPPYIQKIRGERKNRLSEAKWYQTAWAQNPGSLAAPTASLHFSKSDLECLTRNHAVQVAPITLHIGIGTFLPIKSATLKEHTMHSEWAHVPASTIQAIKTAQMKGHRVWALGTTSVRAIESWAQKKLEAQKNGDFIGDTNLFIQPGYEFKICSGLLTNFHQPASTLLALVSAFAGQEQVMRAYKYAISNNFRLFSYGDLSVWTL